MPKLLQRVFLQTCSMGHCTTPAEEIAGSAVECQAELFHKVEAYGGLVGILKVAPNFARDAVALQEFAGTGNSPLTN